ncbi:MAG: XdhC family protein [Lawsonibacter sp.]|jgi:xanthine dehydrogenase accessory factor
MDNPLTLLSSTLSAGQPAVLVFVLSSSGSTPSRPGATMLVSHQGRLAGTVGGGALELQCLHLAQTLLDSSIPQTKSFICQENNPSGLDMACGGSAQVCFFPFSPNNPQSLVMAQHLSDLFTLGEIGWLILSLPSHGKPGLSVYRPDFVLEGISVPDGIFRQLDGPVVQTVLEDTRYLCLRFPSSGRVFLLGAGHIAQHLVPLLHAVEFPCIVLDDRSDFCQSNYFPDAFQICPLSSFDDPTPYKAVTQEDYICIMTHNHQADFLALSQALHTPARYIGVVGSRRKRETMFAKLTAMGFSQADLSRIITPIGLEIHAKTPAEIAVSIAGQLILTRASTS